MKQVQIIISPNGQTRIETTGFAGADCQTASRYLEEALGNRQSETLTAEFYATGTEQQRLREDQ